MHHPSLGTDESAHATAPANGGVLSRERVLAFVLILITLIAFVMCFLMIKPFIAALAWALALAIITRPLHRWFSTYIPNRDVAAGLAVGCVVVVLVIPACFVVHQISLEAGQAVQSVQQSTQDWKQSLRDYPRVIEAGEWIEGNLDVRGEVPRLASTYAGGVVTGSIWAVTQLLLSLFCLYYLFRDHNAALRGVRGLLPLNREESDQLFKRVDDTVHATVYGTLLCAAVQGFMGGLMFWFLGLPAPLTWGFIMGLLAVVPYLGTFVIWGPASLTLALQGQWGKAGILVAWGVLAIGLIDNLLYPIFVGKRLRMHSVVALFAILGGLALFGTSGLVLGPVLVGVTFVFINVWRERLSDGKAAEEGVNEGGGTPPALITKKSEQVQVGV